MCARSLRKRALSSMKPSGSKQRLTIDDEVERRPAIHDLRLFDEPTVRVTLRVGAGQIDELIPMRPHLPARELIDSPVREALVPDQLLPDRRDLDFDDSNASIRADRVFRFA